MDECSEGVHDCSRSADCVNVAGSYACICQSGFQGDGRICLGKLKLSSLALAHFVSSSQISMSA